MDKSKVYELFLDFIGGNSIEIEGIHLKPERMGRDPRTIEFSIQNFNDVPYYSEIIIEYLKDVMGDFSKYTNIYFKPRLLDEYMGVYLNETVKNQIQSVFDSKTTLQLSTYNKTVKIMGSSTGFNIESHDDTIMIWNEFDAKRGIWYYSNTNEEISRDLGECISEYFNIIENDSRGTESEQVYVVLDDILSKYPLISAEWTVLYYHTGFNNLS
jgi:hypothetical protein